MRVTRFFLGSRSVPRVETGLTYLVLLFPVLLLFCSLPDLTPSLPSYALTLSLSFPLPFFSSLFPAPSPAGVLPLSGPQVSLRTSACFAVQSPGPTHSGRPPRSRALDPLRGPAGVVTSDVINRTGWVDVP